MAQSIFVQNPERYDRIALIPPFGIGPRELNIPMTQEILDSRFGNFPVLRLSSAEWVFAARAASMLAPGGRAVVVMPVNALNGTQSLSYRKFLVRNGFVEAVVSVPRGFMNGTGIGFAIVVLREGSNAIKFVNGEAYLTGLTGFSGLGNVDNPANPVKKDSLDVARLLRDYRNLNDFESVKSLSIERVFKNECNLMPDFYLGEDLVYNNSKPLGKMIREIRRGAKLPSEAWKSVEGDAFSPVRKVAFKHLSEGLIDECLPGLTAVPSGAEDAVLEPGDLLISRMGFPFKVAVVEYRNEKLVADENVWIVRMGGNRALAYYLRAYLESERGAKWLSRLSAGATLRTISAKNIEKIPVPDAEEAEIEKIARELETATLIVRENRRRLNESLAAMAGCFDRMRQG